MADEKRLIKKIKDDQDGELRQLSVQVKTDFKKAKLQLKQVTLCYDLFLFLFYFLKFFFVATL